MRSLLGSIVCAVAIYISSALAQLEVANNSTMPTSPYKTRPHTWAPAITITQSGNYTDGYIFIAPYQSPGSGAYIYDKFGNLVFDGFGTIGSANAHDFKVCSYKGVDHLCVTQVNQQLGYGMGMGLIFDNNYRVVSSVQTGNNALPADMHEFQLLDDGQGGNTAILSSYRTIEFDMSYFNITSGQGWLSEGLFQEVDVATGDVLFEWYSSNHVDPSDTEIAINGTDVSGDGLTPYTAFDYFHINSIDKSTYTGNYLVSARHTCTIYYINCTDQNIIWQLSYKRVSDFDITNFNFSFQHDVRILTETDTGMTLSMFDNANDCTTETSSTSSGRIISIDYSARTATQISQTWPPGNLSSCSQGNTQTLSNGGTFHGWGSQPWFSEHDPNGDIVLAGYFANATTMNYRAYTLPWQSTPSNTKPAVYSYALNSNSSNEIYVSWNGATTVATWRYYGADQIGDPFDLIGSTARAGFETTWTAPQFNQWIMVEAVASDGTSLRNSSFTPTFTPGPALVNSCNTGFCATATSYSTPS